MKTDHGLFLPLLKPVIPQYPAIMFVDLAIPTFPVEKLAGTDPKPDDEMRNAETRPFFQLRNHFTLLGQTFFESRDLVFVKSLLELRFFSKSQRAALEQLFLPAVKQSRLDLIFVADVGQGFLIQKRFPENRNLLLGAEKPSPLAPIFPHLIFAYNLTKPEENSNSD